MKILFCLVLFSMSVFADDGFHSGASAKKISDTEYVARSVALNHTTVFLKRDTIKYAKKKIIELCSADHDLKTCKKNLEFIIESYRHDDDGCEGVPFCDIGKAVVRGILKIE